LKLSEILFMVSGTILSNQNQPHNCSSYFYIIPNELTTI
jgi:hypothetical protein